MERCVPLLMEKGSGEGAVPPPSSNKNFGNIAYEMLQLGAYPYVFTSNVIEFAVCSALLLYHCVHILCKNSNGEHRWVFIFLS